MKTTYYIEGIGKGERAGIYRKVGECPKKLFFSDGTLRTHNQAEYWTLICVLEQMQPDEEATIYCHLELIVNQVNRKWRVHSEDILNLFNKTAALLKTRKVSLVWLSHPELLECIKFGEDAVAP
jgi:ribonuclease HI